MPRRGRGKEVAAAKVEEREGERKADDGQQLMRCRARRITGVEAELEIRREAAAARECQRPLGGAQRRLGRGDGKQHSPLGEGSVGWWAQRIEQHDRRLVAAEPYLQLQRQERFEGGERVVGGDVRELPR